MTRTSSPTLNGSAGVRDLSLVAPGSPIQLLCAAMIMALNGEGETVDLEYEPDDQGGRREAGRA